MKPNGGFRLNGDVIEKWSERWKRWQRIAEFDGYITNFAKQAIVGALNGSQNLLADWHEWEEASRVPDPVRMPK